jgi:hypothetical protein
LTRPTYTIATLELSPAAFDEIAGKLKVVGYAHAFMPGGSIDMTGLAVSRSEPANTEPDEADVGGRAAGERGCDP